MPNLGDKQMQISCMPIGNDTEPKEHGGGVRGFGFFSRSVILFSSGGTI